MTEQEAHIHKPHLGSRFHFARHLVEMFLSMQVGMMLGAGLLAAAFGASVAEVRREHAVAWVLVMALDMTVPMVAVMLYRGHSWRSAFEMAAAMVVPALPIVALQLGQPGGGSIGRAYMPVSMIAMIALIVYRRNEYRAAAGVHAAEPQRRPPGDTRTLDVRRHVERALHGHARQPRRDHGTAGARRPLASPQPDGERVADAFDHFGRAQATR